MISFNKPYHIAIEKARRKFWFLPYFQQDKPQATFYETIKIDGTVKSRFQIFAPQPVVGIYVLLLPYSVVAIQIFDFLRDHQDLGK